MSTASHQPLQKDDWALLAVHLLILILVGDSAPEVHGGRRPHLHFLEQVLILVLLVFHFLLFNSYVNGWLGFLQGYNMSVFFSCERFFEIKFHLINTHFWIINAVWQGSRKFLKTLICRKSLRLDLVLVGFLIKWETFTSDGSIYRWPEVSIFFDDIPLQSFDLNIFPSFVHLSEHLDPLPLNFSECPLLIFSFLEPDLLSPLRMLLLSLLLPLDQCTLQEIKSIILVLFDLVFSFLPVTHFLLLHQLPAQAERRLVWGGRQGVQESTLVPHLADQLHLGLAGWQSTAIHQVLDT